jgi:chitosanase
MHRTQDIFFDIIYWDPALKFAMDNGFKAPLSMLVIYDSYIHSGGIFDFLRRRFPEVPPRRGGDEKAWVKAYVRERHEWLLSKGGLLARTVYRTNCFMEQFQLENWDLTKPVDVIGKDVIE